MQNTPPRRPPPPPPKTEDSVLSTITTSSTADLQDECLHLRATLSTLEEQFNQILAKRESEIKSSMLETWKQNEVRIKSEMSKEVSEMSLQIVQLQRELLSAANEHSVQLRILEEKNRKLEEKYEESVEESNKVIHDLQRRLQLKELHEVMETNKIQELETQYEHSVLNEQKQVSELRSLLESHESTIVQLRNQCEGMSRTIELMKKSNLLKESQREGDLAEVVKMKDALSTQYSLCRETIIQLEERNRTLEQNLVSLKKEHASLRETATVAIEQLNEKQNLVKILQRENESLRTNLQQAKKSDEVAKSQSEQRNRNFQQLEVELEKLRDECRHKEILNRSLVSEIDAMQQQHLDKEDAVGKLEKEHLLLLNSFQEIRDGCERSCLLLRKELEAAIRDKTNIQETLLKYRTKCQVLESKQQELFECQVKVRDLESALDDSARRNKQLMMDATRVDGAGVVAVSSSHGGMFSGSDRETVTRLRKEILELHEKNHTLRCMCGDLQNKLQNQDVVMSKLTVGDEVRGIVEIR
eukprot:PhF_6_TR35419/c0_g1_i2/m.51568